MGSEPKTATAFLWDNFGPMHVDRCVAVADRLAERSKVIGIELYPASSTYAWDAPRVGGFEKLTLFESTATPPGLLARAYRIFRVVRQRRIRYLFLCHYDRPEVTLTAILARMIGVRVFVMSCSKYDDKPRRAWTEALKSLALTPFHGGLSSGSRPADYLRFLGVPAARIRGEYNTLSIDRMRAQSAVPPAPDGTPFESRDFVVVARFVPKKNLGMVIDAYARYRAQSTAPRRLVLCGSGPLEADLRAQVAALALDEAVEFTGFVQTEGVSEYLGRALALLLPSVEEQFGNVVIEAQALGLPVILSDNCGARDRLVRSGVNGFVIEPDNPQGLALFMQLLSDDRDLWTRMAVAASVAAEGGDVARFADGVEALCTGPA